MHTTYYNINLARVSRLCGSYIPTFSCFVACDYGVCFCLTIIEKGSDSTIRIIYIYICVCVRARTRVPCTRETRFLTLFPRDISPGKRLYCILYYEYIYIIYMCIQLFHLSRSRPEGAAGDC
jgi:hypothetical protein